MSRMQHLSRVHRSAVIDYTPPSRLLHSHAGVPIRAACSHLLSLRPGNKLAEMFLLVLFTSATLFHNLLRLMFNRINFFGLAVLRCGCQLHPFYCHVNTKRTASHSGSCSVNYTGLAVPGGEPANRKISQNKIYSLKCLQRIPFHLLL